MRLKPAVRAVLGVGMGGAIYFLGLVVVPSLRPVERLVEATPWFSRVDVSQMTYLILSLGLIVVLSGGSIRGYGIKGAGVRQVLRPVLTSVAASLLLLVLAMVVMAASGPSGETGQHPAMAGGMIKVIVSVWLVASICEEVLSRGLVLGFLGPLQIYGFRLLKWRLSLPVTVSAAGFGLGHLCLLGAMDTRLVALAVVNATVLGLIAGYHRERTGSLLPAIAVHMTFNVMMGGISTLLTSLVPA